MNPCYSRNPCRLVLTTIYVCNSFIWLEGNKNLLWQICLTPFSEPRHLENEPPVRRINISFLHPKKDRSHVDVQTKILTGANPHKQFKFTVNVPQFRRKNSNKSKKNFFVKSKCIFGSFKLFPSSIIDFCPFLKSEKMNLAKKILFPEIDLLPNW